MVVTPSGQLTLSKFDPIEFVFTSKTVLSGTKLDVRSTPLGLCQGWHRSKGTKRRTPKCRILRIPCVAHFFGDWPTALPCADVQCAASLPHPFGLFPKKLRYSVRHNGDFNPELPSLLIFPPLDAAEQRKQNWMKFASCLSPRREKRDRRVWRTPQ
jgi:hypothetical protein